VMWFRPRANRAGQHASLPWRPEEREAANELRRAALDVLVERSLRVGRRASSLSRDNEALVSADRRKDAFIAMLGHELRTPLAALEYGLATLERAQADGRTAPEALALISRQTRQMGALVDDIVDIARIRHNRLALRRRRLRVAEIVRHAVEATAAAFERAGQTVTVSADPTLTVMADPVRLTQILTNLIVNALRHGASARPIEIHARPERGFAAIDVRDHGAGIAPALQRTIFEAFSAPAAEHGSANTGLGLGLALVRRLVESHGGSIAVASEPGRGACFTVRLPRLDDAPAAGGGAPTRPASVPARSRRVLVVDDDPDAAVSLAMLLRAYGHEARKAQDGETALSVLTRFDADIVTIDLGLPDIDGASLAREIRARVATPVLIVCISGELPESGVDADAFDHLLMKPARPEQLFSIIDGFD